MRQALDAVFSIAIDPDVGDVGDDQMTILPDFRTMHWQVLCRAAPAAAMTELG